MNRGLKINVVSSVVLAALLASAPAASAEKAVSEIGYFLAKTQIKITVAQTLASCEPGKAPEIDTAIEIEAIGKPNDYVKVDTKSGFLAQRSTALELAPNGTLAAFNAKSEGQGGKVIAAGIKLATTIGAAAAPAANQKDASPDKKPTPSPPPVPTPLVCSDDANDLLTALANRKADIKSLETRIIAQGGNAADLAIIERRRAQVSALTDALTIEASQLIDPVYAGDQEVRIDPTDLKPWFVPNGNLPAALAAAGIPGSYGYLVKFKPDGAQLAAVANGDGKFTVGDLGKALPYLIYRRPVDTDVTVSPCEAAEAEAKTCASATGRAAEAITTSDTVPIAQFSGLFAIRVGRGGIFGTREAKAEFDEFGAPKLLSYGTASGADEVAGVLDAGTEGIGTITDGKLKALERRLAIAKARKELAELGSTE